MCAFVPHLLCVAQRSRWSARWKTTQIDSLVPNYGCPNADAIRAAYQSVPAWTNHLVQFQDLQQRLDETLGTTGLSAWNSWCAYAHSWVHSGDKHYSHTEGSHRRSLFRYVQLAYVSRPPTSMQCQRRVCVTRGCRYRVRAWRLGIQVSSAYLHISFTLD